MANVWVRAGLDPDAPDEVHVVVGLDPNGSSEERAVAHVIGGAYEGEGVMHVVQTDAWVERTLEGSTLAIDLVAYPAALEGLDADVAGHAERSRVDPSAVRILRAVAAVDPGLYARAQPATVVFEVPAGTGIDDIAAAVEEETVTPVIFAPPPA